MGLADTGTQEATRIRAIEQVRLSELVQFLPKQQIAFDAMWRYKYVLFGGARGPGKSYLLRWAALLFLLWCVYKLGLRDVRVGLFCETYPELQDRQISKIAKEFPSWLGKVTETKTDGLGFFLYPEYGGGGILLRNLDRPEKYQSAEFAGIFWDELTKNTESVFHVLRASKRWPGIYHTPFIAASNPGNIGHMWVKNFWLDHVYPSELAAEEPEFHFIPALPFDNPYLEQSYWDELNTLPEPLRSAWMYGNWDVFAGMAFPMWNPFVHVVEPFEIPQHWPAWCGTDWGFTSPYCNLWLRMNPDNGRIFVSRESYATELTQQVQAKTIKAMTPANEHIIEYLADPAMFAKNNTDYDGADIADVYRNEGIILTEADNNRVLGKNKVAQALSNLPDGKPGLQVFRNCTNLIMQLGSLPCDEINPEDTPKKAVDHAYSALRYALTRYTLNTPTTKRDEEEAISHSPLEMLKGI